MDRLDFFDDDEETGTVFRDVVFLALAGFVAIVLMLLPHLNPPTKDEAEVDSPGNLIVELHWDKELDVDIDLWVEAPGDVPVGYSNKAGRIFNLLRDDMGQMADVTPINYEVSYSRGLPAGEYTANLHLYRVAAALLPVEATLVISLKSTPEGSAKRLLNKKLLLQRNGQELTAFRFSIDENGRLVAGSVHDLPRALRSSPS